MIAAAGTSNLMINWNGKVSVQRSAAHPFGIRNLASFQDRRLLVPRSVGQAIP
jgi:hypothetical protein